MASVRAVVQRGVRSLIRGDDTTDKETDKVRWRLTRSCQASLAAADRRLVAPLDSGRKSIGSLSERRRWEVIAWSAEN